MRRVVLGASCRRQAEPQRGEALQRLVVQLARPAPALLLGGGDALARTARRRRSARWRRPSPRSRRRTRSSRRSSSLKSRSVLEAVGDDQHAVWRPAEDRAAPRGRPRSGTPRRPSPWRSKRLRLIVVFQALRAAASAARSRPTVPCDRHALADQHARDLAGDRGDHELVAVEQLDGQRSGRDQRAAALGDELEDAVQVGLTAERQRDLDRGVQRGDGPAELLAPGLRAGEAAGVVDRDAGEIGEQ